MLSHYVYFFPDLDYEVVGRSYVSTRRLPQIAIDNILHSWRRQREFNSAQGDWWTKERSNIGNYLVGVGSFCIVYSIIYAGILSRTNFFNEYLNSFLSVLFGCVAQYYFHRKQNLDEIAQRLQRIRTEDYRVLRPGDENYDPSDEVAAKNIKLMDWQTESEDALEFNSIYRLPTMLVLLIVALIILKLL